MTVREAYAALSLDPYESTPEQIRAAYRFAITQNHPDRVHGLNEEKAATAKTIALNLAYEHLQNSGFPRLLKPSVEQTMREPLRYETQIAAPDQDFETWRRAFKMRDPRAVLKDDFAQFGIFKTTTAWISYAVKIFFGLILAACGIAVFANGSPWWGLGLLAFGGIYAFFQLQELLSK